jgi:hypothetical protein
MGPSKELMLRIIKAKREGKVEVSQVVLNWMMEGEHQYQSQLWSEHADYWKRMWTTLDKDRNYQGGK